MQVTKQDAKRALAENFGGQDDSGVYRYTRSSNAYLLVYVRETEWPGIMSQVMSPDKPDCMHGCVLVLQLVLAELHPRCMPGA